MRAHLDPFRFLILTVAGWINQRQRDVIDFLVEENRVLREQIGDRRLRFTDNQRRRLAAKAKVVGRKWLSEIATLVTPETLLACHRKLIAQKYDGSSKRGPGQPRILADAEALILRMARENRDWGYRRLQGALRNLGYDYAKSTVANIVKSMGWSQRRSEAEKQLGRNF